MCLKIDLNRTCLAIGDKASVLTQLQSQSQSVNIQKSLLGLTMLKQIQHLLICMILSMYITFTIVENPLFQDMLSIFSLTLAI